MDWSEIKDAFVSIGCLPVIAALVTLLLSDYLARRREERERRDRLVQAEGERQERLDSSKREARINHLRDVLDIMRESKAAFASLTQEVLLDNWIIPDKGWQARFMEIHSRFESAIISALNIDRKSLPNGAINFVIESDGLFKGKTRLVGYHDYRQRMDAAEGKVTDLLYELYTNIEQTKA
jgi:hypothetical protein